VKVVTHGACDRTINVGYHDEYRRYRRSAFRLKLSVARQLPEWDFGCATLIAEFLVPATTTENSALSPSATVGSTARNDVRWS